MLLNVNRHGRHGQRMTILFVLALPHELWVERRVAGVQQPLERDVLGLRLVLRNELPQLLRRDIRPLHAVFDGLNSDRGLAALSARHFRDPLSALQGTRSPLGPG